LVELSGVPTTTLQTMFEFGVNGVNTSKDAATLAPREGERAVR